LNLSATAIPTQCAGGTPVPARARPNISFGLFIAIVLWLAAVAGATILMTGYSNTPGREGLVPTSWPKGSRIPLDSQRPTLVMFAHPHCPCTRASLAELERLAAEVPGKFSIQVIFLKPVDTAADWEKTELWRKASSIPDVAIYTDVAGREARRFHAETSGETLLYDPAGSLRFQGGITFSRGHEGDNPGRSALRELKGHSTQVKTPVFGCALFEAPCREGEVLCKP